MRQQMPVQPVAQDVAGQTKGRAHCRTNKICHSWCSQADALGAPGFAQLAHTGMTCQLTDTQR